MCALYIPEVRFGNVSTMEPIILQLIPPERYNKCKSMDPRFPRVMFIEIFISFSVLHLCGWREGIEGNSRRMHAV